MNRREAIRLLATGAVLPLTPGTVMAMLRDARTVVGTQPALRTLNPHQEATVKTMAEMILPRTDTPGATDVGATEFIDLMLTEWYDDSDRERFLTGLADVDHRSQSLFGKDFVDCQAMQQAEILASLGEKMAAEVDLAPDRGRPMRGARPRTDESFYPMLRRLTLTAYYTSEAGATAELEFEVIPDHFDACAPAQAGKEGGDRQ
jgi:glucoside 3-dehydrogenase (cytochrome c) hitch-hiker subunit